MKVDSELGKWLLFVKFVSKWRSKKSYELLFELQKAIEFYCLVIKIHEHYYAKPCVVNFACLDEMGLLENKIRKD